MDARVILLLAPCAYAGAIFATASLLEPLSLVGTQFVWITSDGTACINYEAGETSLNDTYLAEAHDINISYSLISRGSIAIDSRTYIDNSTAAIEFIEQWRSIRNTTNPVTNLTYTVPEVGDQYYDESSDLVIRNLMCLHGIVAGYAALANLPSAPISFAQAETNQLSISDFSTMNITELQNKSGMLFYPSVFDTNVTTPFGNMLWDADGNWVGQSLLFSYYDENGVPVQFGSISGANNLYNQTQPIVFFGG